MVHCAKPECQTTAGCQCNKRTATEVMQDRDAWRDERTVHGYMERFTRRWAPSDREAAAEFHSDFLLVVQAIHRDSARPMHDALTKTFAAMPPMIFPKSN